MKDLILKSGRDRSLRNRHPWIFSGAVKTAPQAETGDIIRILTNNGELIAYGHFLADRNIICKIFAFTAEEQEFDGAYWQEGFRKALDYRMELVDLDKTNGFRLLHGEGDSFPGLVVDIYGKAASVQARNPGAAAWIPHLMDFFEQEDRLEIEAVYCTKGQGKKIESEWLKGERGLFEFKENGLLFQVDIEEGQKTGFFLDQRENREQVAEFAKGKRVLNAFSYTGAFSLYALRGGAEYVESVDISAKAVEASREIINLNASQLDPQKHEAVKADCFKYLNEIEKDQFDLIILDPPAFTKHISTVKRAARGYKEINLKALRKVSSGGWLFTFSCSQHISPDLFRKIVFGAAADAGREVRIVRQLSQSPDHPISIFHPEGEYLKGLLLFVS